MSRDPGALRVLDLSFAFNFDCAICNSHVILATSSEPIPGVPWYCGPVLASDVYLPVCWACSDRWQAWRDSMLYWGA